MGSSRIYQKNLIYFSPVFPSPGRRPPEPGNAAASGDRRAPGSRKPPRNRSVLPEQAPDKCENCWRGFHLPSGSQKTEFRFSFVVVDVPPLHALWIIPFLQILVHGLGLRDFLAAALTSGQDQPGSGFSAAYFAAASRLSSKLWRVRPFTWAPSTITQSRSAGVSYHLFSNLKRMPQKDEGPPLL